MKLYPKSMIFKTACWLVSRLLNEIKMFCGLISWWTLATLVIPPFNSVETVEEPGLRTYI